MRLPEFFDAAPRIPVRDPLARFVGAAEDGVIEYTYADTVKLAGHSCPTVASAYLMTRVAMRTLYPDTLPERGGIRVELRGDRLEGVIGAGTPAFAAGGQRHAAGDAGQIKDAAGHRSRADGARSSIRASSPSSRSGKNDVR